MLFHCTHTHKAEQCLLNDPEDATRRLNEMKAFADKNDVRLVAAYSNSLGHRAFFVVEADSTEKLDGFFRPMLTKGHIEVVPVTDDSTMFRPTK